MPTDACSRAKRKSSTPRVRTASATSSWLTGRWAPSIAWRSTAAPSQARDILHRRAAAVAINPRLAAKIASADLIIYAPGTQHSSLFPSYLTPGLSAAIAGNLAAIKLLITNIQADAEITGSNAVDIIDRAVFYLKEKGRLAAPTPCLITHYLLNDPGREDTATPYVPLGPLESIEDPRLVRIGNYEEGVTGRHDAARVLAPFIESILSRAQRKRVAVLLHDGGSINKVAQTLLEMIRGGIEQLPLDVTVFYGGTEPLDARFIGSLPFAVHALPGGDRTFAPSARAGGFDYVILFESSGMYRGEDVVGLASHLVGGRLDAVWGSRRLSIRDIEESYRLRYRPNARSRGDQLRGQPCAQPGVPGVLWPLHFRHAVGGARRPRRRRLRPGDRSGPQAGQSSPPGAAAATGRRSSSRFRCSSSRSRRADQAHEPARGAAGARRDRLAAASSAPRPPRGAPPDTWRLGREAAAVRPAAAAR